MLERHTHLPDFHRERLPLQAGQGMLCLAPHPDDEVLGGGGLLLLAQQQGLRVQSIIVTAGEQGLGQSSPSQSDNPRLLESAEAARRMGLPAPGCWHLGDRQLRHSAPLVDRIAALLRQERPRWLLLPALTEPHPDHQVLALAGLSAAQAVARQDPGADTALLFYEVGMPTQVNTLVDITAVAATKWQALEAFASQEERHTYLQHAQSMAALRAFGAGEGVQAAEAFWQVSAQALRQPGLLAALSAWPLQRNHQGLASEPAQQPLVSVIIRSMHRPCLAEAVASVAQQTYAHIEVLVVNASGAPHPVPPHPAERLALRVVEAGDSASPQRLGRSAAANLGLRTARGAYALFLDDDDLLAPTHIDRLVSALQPEGQAVAAYSGVRVEGPNGHWLRDYDIPWEPRRLRGINHLPIHAVLFRLPAVQQAGAHFDEDLPVLEDWDFWCQLSHLGRFVHVPGISATYRQGLGDSHLGDAQHANHWARWHSLILQRHTARWGADEQSDALAWHALALDRSELEHAHTQRSHADTQALLQQTQQDQAALQQAQIQAIAQLQHLSEVQQHTQQQLQQAHEALQQAQQQHYHLSEQLQQTQGALARSEAERELAQRSLAQLQQSRSVRLARALRRGLGR